MDRDLTDGLTLSAINQAYYDMEVEDNFDQWTLEKAVAVLVIRRLTMLDTVTHNPCVEIVTHRGTYRATLGACTCPAADKPKPGYCKHQLAVHLAVRARIILDKSKEGLRNHVRANLK